MSLITEIQQAAVEKGTDLATLLRKCKVLATRLGSVPLEDWVLHESNGYPPGMDLPDYRVWGVQIVAHLMDQFGAQMQNVMVAPHMIPEVVRTRFSRFEYRDSVATAEYVLRNHDEGMQTFATSNLRSMLHGKVYKGFQCHSAVAQFSNQHLVAMLDAVRNRILDFALALGKIAPDAGEGQAQVEVQRVTQIFNMTIHGSVGVVGTANNAIVNVTTNDWAALAQFLATNGAAADDIDDLRDAVTEEPQPETGRWGPRVSTWIGKMMGKAADGTWQVGPGAAGNLLAQAIAAYYAGRGRPPLSPRRTRSRQPLDVKTLAMSLPSSAYQRISWREGTNASLSGRSAAAHVHD